jgi:hypothetical protein
MTGEQSPLSQSPFDQIDWPLDGCVALVLDGASIPNIDKTIYEWTDGIVEAECLYASTRWEPVSEFAPWLVWLNSDDDPIVRKFLEEGAVKESGYFLVSAHKPDLLRQYLRQLLVIERVPGCEELLRIAHPELARSIIGRGQISPGPVLPSDLVHRIATPDLVTGAWVIQEPPRRPSRFERQEISVNAESLDADFSAFNRRRANLMLWELLDPQLCEWLGGPSLSDAHSKLSQLTRQAEQKGHRSPREQMRYLLEQYHEHNQAPINASAAQNFMDEE